MTARTHTYVLLAEVAALHDSVVRRCDASETDRQLYFDRRARLFELGVTLDARPTFSEGGAR